MHSLVCFSIFAAAAFAQTQYTSTGTAAVAKARATALTESPTSNVAGKTFDRFVTICKNFNISYQVMKVTDTGLENTDYSSAAADRELSSLIFQENL
jgi:hypothetical protein